VDAFAAVRAAGDGDLLRGEAEAVGRARRDERDGLQGLGGRTQVGDGFGRAERGDDVAVAVNRDDMAAMTRFGDRAARHFDERRGRRDIVSFHLLFG
jgi:hypothetical protein